MKIKKYIQGICLVGLLFFTASCSDYLTVDNTDLQTTNSFYQTEGQCDQAITGLYNNLLPVSLSKWMLSEVRSDNTWIDVSTSARQEITEIAAFYTTITDANRVTQNWNNLFQLIANCNLFLQKIQGVEFTDEKIKAQFIGEAHFLRAYAYFELVLTYGGVPLITEPISQEEALQTHRSEAKEVYEQVIVPDLEFARKNLNDKPTDARGTAVIGRATRIAAEALLGRVFLTMSGYPLYLDKKAEAKTALKIVLDYASSEGKYWANTADEWVRMWTNENDNKYHIFEIQYEKGGFGLGNPMVFESTPAYYSAYTVVRLRGWNIFASRSLMNDYAVPTELLEEHDVRYAATVDTVRYLNTDNTPPTEGGGVQSARHIKFFEHKIKRAALGLPDIDLSMVGYEDWPINFPIIRLEDVMLMYAELVGPTDEGIELVNRIRTRAGLSPVSGGISEDEFQQTVALERRLELAGEGIRWHDLVRSGKWQEALRDHFYEYAYNSETETWDEAIKAVGDKVMATPGFYLFPIPADQIRVKDGLYEQNEAYR